MKKISQFTAAMAAALFLLTTSPAVMAGGSSDLVYLGGIEDLPLMPGLVENPEVAMVFDTPSGRIVESFAQGRVSAAAVRSFYDDTLPQLGWQKEGQGGFRRENELLIIETAGVGVGGELTVRFALSPVQP